MKPTALPQYVFNRLLEAYRRSKPSDGNDLIVMGGSKGNALLEQVVAAPAVPIVNLNDPDGYLYMILGIHDFTDDVLIGPE